jgi:peptide-methionine (S)-S-oxide reductase
LHLSLGIEFVGMNDSTNEVSNSMEIATLGGGCFWCLEAVFRELQGVTRVVSGYAGGAEPHPTYEEVCAGVTGHAEVVQVHFDPGVVRFDEILLVFFSIHDPTTLNRQGADIGAQYRSVILWDSDAQREAAERIIAELEAEGIWSAPIVTEVAPLETFYPAEDYHQEYFERNPNQPYCQVVIEPKLAKFRSAFAERLKERFE